MLDVRRLHMLRELSERGTIAATAQALGYSAPAVSQHLAALERQVGVSLLERQGRRVALTPAARLLVGRTERVLAELEAAEAELAAGDGERARQRAPGRLPHRRGDARAAGDGGLRRPPSAAPRSCSPSSSRRTRCPP